MTGDSQYSEMHIHVLFVLQPCPEVLAQNWSPVVAGTEGPHRKV